VLDEFGEGHVCYGGEGWEIKSVEVGVRDWRSPWIDVDGI
jgi:hypothetical protein